MTKFNKLDFDGIKHLDKSLIPSKFGIFLMDTYTLIPDEASVESLSRLVDKKVILDTETDGLNLTTSKPFMIQFMETRDGKPSVINISRLNDEEVAFVIECLSKAECLVGHNLKFDIHMIANLQSDIENPLSFIEKTNLYCTMIAEQTIQSDRFSYTLDNLAYSLLEKRKTDNLMEIASNTLFNGKKVSKKNYMGRLIELPFNDVAHYGSYDVVLTKDIFINQMKRIDESASNGGKPIHPVIKMEMELLKNILAIEDYGIKIDSDRLDKAIVSFDERMNELKKKLNSCNIDGKDVNVNKASDLVDLFTHNNLDIVKTPKGNPSFSKDTMSNYSNQSDIVSLINEQRAIAKFYATCILGIKNEMQVDGVIHPNLNQNQARTGRFSCSSPNLQAIPNPSRQKQEFSKTLATSIRKSIVARDGKILMSIDYNQFEDRIFAFFSNDERIWKQYKSDPDTDYHQAVADICKIARDKAKSFNFALKFGGGAGAVAKTLGMDYKVFNGKKVAGEEAKEVIGHFHRMFPSASRFLKKAERLARKRGYIKTIMGRRMYFPSGDYYKAGGYVLQSNAADIIKVKIVEISKFLKKRLSIEGKILLAIHDEILIEVKDRGDESNKKVLNEIVTIMEDVKILAPIPIRASGYISYDWSET